MIRKILAMMTFVLPCIVGVAQVSNNNITDRSELVQNAVATHSNTNNASVEWDCVNKKLTNKCLVYHNDQWFHFTPDRDGKFFLNVSSQQCRNRQGIQVIVIEGNPCQINTYKILRCISKIHQDDAFIELDSLKAGIQYLVNIDGFLGDFCQFDIQFSTTARGFPGTMHNLDTLNMTAARTGRNVTIRWSVHESIAETTSVFRIYRKQQQDVKFTRIQDVSLHANALGDFVKTCEATDTLSRPGTYVYQIFGLRKETEYPVLLDEQTVSYKPGLRVVHIPLKLKEGAPYLVMVFNKANNTMLRKYTGTFNRADGEIFEINLDTFIDAGANEFVVLASEVNAQKPGEFYFRYDGERFVGE
ncbi:MAG: hypothetical protein WAZ98_06715 [Cyclobacteriaceae bacterium]